MSYYGYHPRIKQRIRAGELTGYHWDNDYRRIGPALVLEFSTYPFLRPIRPDHWADYVDILADWGREHDVERGESPERLDASRPA